MTLLFHYVRVANVFMTHITLYNRKGAMEIYIILIFFVTVSHIGGLTHGFVYFMLM